MEHLHSSHIKINIPVPRISAKVSNIRIRESLLQVRVKNVLRKSKEFSQIYLHYRAPKLRDPLQLDVVRKDEFRLPYIRYTNEQDNITSQNRLNSSLQQKYKMTVSQFRNRLYIEDPADDVKALTDIDKGFFNYANGRLISDRVSLYKTLKTIINNILITKLEIGYRHECLLNIDKNRKNEMQIYEKTLKTFTKVTKYLDIFIAQDYRKSLALLEKCEELSNEVHLKRAELKLLADRQSGIVSCLLRLDNMYYVQQIYGRFLYYLSPPSWRASNRNFAQSMEIELKGFDLGTGGDKCFSDIFDKMQKECLSDLVKPAIYFTEPNELVKLFEFIENQQLSCLENVGVLAPLIKQAKDEIKFLKDLIQQESATMLSTIRYIKTLLEDCEGRCSFLENRFYKIANGLFYNCTGAPEVIKLSSHLEFVYKEIFSEEPMNVDIVTIVRSLELFYMHCCNHLDLLLHVNIKDAMKHAVEADHIKMKRAIQARRDLCTFDKLKKKMLKAFEPPPLQKRNYNEVCKANKDTKSQVLHPNKLIKSKRQTKNNNAKKNYLNETELEYLKLFTDWCPDEDPVKYLH